MKRNAMLAIMFAVAFAAGCDDFSFMPWEETNAPSRTPGGKISAGKGMKYTVLLYSFGGSRHIEESRYYKDNTEKHARWRGLYIVHTDTHSRLFWGQYRTMASARSRRDRARKWKTAAGQQPYQGAIIMDIPGRQVGPAQWDLTNADGAYSVVVAVFYDVPEMNYAGRKEFAVKYCRQLREKGEQAFYDHGQTHSAVTIGLFPETAIRMRRKGVQTIPVVQDPRMRALMDRYPRLAVNGREERVPIQVSTDGGPTAQWKGSKSYPIRIPRKEGTYATHRPGYKQPRQDPGNQPSSQPASDLDDLRRRIWGR